MKNFRFLLLLLLSTVAFSQSTKPLKAPNGLDISMTTVQKNALTNKVVGQLVYDSTLAEYQKWDGSAFVSIGGGSGGTLQTVTDAGASTTNEVTIQNIKIRSNADFSVQIGEDVSYGNTGSQQTSVGAYASYNNSGNSQTSIGFGSGSDNSANFQTAIGDNAGVGNSGEAQTSIGYSAGNGNSGPQQISIGNGAGTNNNKESQISIGLSAGQYNRGDFQIAIGEQAGNGYNLGVNQVAIGKYAGVANSGNNQVAIGAYAGRSNEFANTISISAGEGDGTATALPTADKQLVFSANLYSARFNLDIPEDTDVLDFPPVGDRWALLSEIGGGGVASVTSANAARLSIAGTSTDPILDVVSAPKLETARTIAGQSFDGTANITAASLRTGLNIADGANVGVVPNTAITGATKTKITYDSKGLVTAGADLVAADIPNIAQSQVTGLVTDLAARALISNKQNSLATDGTGVKYPTVDAVNSALTMREQSFLYDSTTSATITGVASTQVLLTSYVIAPNTYQSGSKCVLELMLERLTGTNNVTVNLYMNSTAAGDRLGTYLFGGASKYVKMDRTLLFKPSNIIKFFSQSTNSNTDVVSGSSWSTLSFDPTVANTLYIYISSGAGISGDTFAQEFISMRGKKTP